MKQPYVLQLVGYSDSGKTTLLTKLIAHFEQSGMRVGVVKHDGGHDFEWDQQGKDTWRYREAGASLVAITSETKTVIHEQRPTPLPQLIERLTQAGADLILVEGFKREGYPKLVLLRKAEDLELLHIVTAIKGIVTWEPIATDKWPQLSIQDDEAIYQFVKRLLSEEG
ncbi:molybdopterin-guanine dinucleotide biosynthesis protein B [Brevibacillus choshinensis]|uniref:molybdopterin-guanine dinucleotide biosynthesis protein B n=1 Tax=Brevibacillus choshinensis TaxID=54911 RepID=UPI002E1B25E0|nr:molybdopterin-guanine dinucleotide biosynthesis protein B [Brevibacillus choshinensis]MED4753264.1 molybdopterin-guanine dinucleotide biosynthesis protein B [Brevibacillus choshinensis]MED4782310.1 molybdopterin-guanine dinucleotide biosynthesis protein B [Brevibacillus choshinensis]